VLRKKLIASLMLLLVLIGAAVSAQGQTPFIDFPAGSSGTPKPALKGRVHVVLTTEQRDEYVFSTTTEVYDEKGRIIELLSTNANIETHSQTLIRLGSKRTYIYASSGELSRVNKFHPDGTMWGYDVYKYDDKRRLIEIAIFDKDGKSGGWHRYSYDPEKKEVEATWLFVYSDSETAGNPMRSLLKYDDEGRWVARTFLGDTTTFEYDKDGNFIKQSKNTYGHSYRYEFDKYGNWIARSTTYFQNGRPDAPGWMNEYRIITYYPELSVN
jgi:hypothetical protein